MNYKSLALMCQISYEHADFTTDDGTQWIVRELDGHRVIAYRGTRFDYKDILKDLRGYPWPAYGTFVHRGFMLGVEQAWLHLGLYENQTQPLILTGHSLGGGLAYATARKMQHQRLPVPIVVTFGAPRSCFAPPVVAAGSRRYVNGYDCIPKHPWALWGYRHDDRLFEIGEPGDRFLDHRIAEYVRNVG